MRQPYEFFAGLRYTRAKRRNHFISFISAASMAGIAIGVMTLITVLSVMNGFEREMRVRLLSMASHVTLSGFDGAVHDWPQVAKEAQQNKEVLTAAPYVEGQGMLRMDSGLSGVLLRGILPEEEVKVSELGTHMEEGQLADLKAGEFKIVLGNELAQALGVRLGDKVDLMIPQASVTPAGVIPRFRRFTVSGIFKSGMYQVDSGLVLIQLADAQALYRLGDTVSGVRLKLKDLFRAQAVARELNASMPGFYSRDWTQSNANLLSAIAMEKTVMFIILSLIVGVAAFNIVSTLVMVVQDKQADIAILRTLGARPASIMAIFMVQGSIIGIVGTLVGVVLGVALALNVETLVPWLQQLTGHEFISADVYQISEVPSQLEAYDVIRIGLLSLGLGLISTLYPAWRASRVQPAEALRYE